jgi:hypothetical protein
MKCGKEKEGRKRRQEAEAGRWEKETNNKLY